MFIFPLSYCTVNSTDAPARSRVEFLEDRNYNVADIVVTAPGTPSLESTTQVPNLLSGSSVSLPEGRAREPTPPEATCTQ